MDQRIITLCYRKIIDLNNTGTWDRLVHQDSFTEFKIQSHYYNQQNKYNTFADLILNVPHAEKLHFLVSASVTGYLGQLNGIIPDVTDNLGRRFLNFEGSRFELISSDLNNIDKHKIGINFFSVPLIWHDTIDNCLLISPLKEVQEDLIFTNLYKIQDFVSIHSLKTV